MKISLVTYGSRGDVEPFIALGIGFLKKGHEVTLAAPFQFAAYIESHGIKAIPLAGDVKAILHSDKGKELLSQTNSLKVIKMISDQLYDLRHDLWKGLKTAAEGADIVVVSTIILHHMATLAQKYNLPVVAIQLNPPIVPTGKFPFMDIFSFNLKFPFLNYLTYHLLLKFAWAHVLPEITEHRATLQLPPISTSYIKYYEIEKVPFIHTISPSVIPRPTDWEAQHIMSGYLFKEEINNNISSDVENWLLKGDPPVYFGFGSMPIPNPQEAIDMIQELVATLRIRAIVVAGFTNLKPFENEHVKIISEANHVWLFPKCSCIVHHGGAGTSAATFRSGKPSVVCSFFGDQPTWGRLATQMGTGVHLSFHKLTAKKLGKAVQRVTKPSYIKNAAILSEKINRENGVETAIAHIEKYYQQKSSLKNR
ncbi:MAG: glycosyltransferase [Bacteroidota bacterium]|nr:glycosyltransferase [Bacteroidota bacterium]